MNRARWSGVGIEWLQEWGKKLLWIKIINLCVASLICLQIHGLSSSLDFRCASSQWACLATSGICLTLVTITGLNTDLRTDFHAWPQTFLIPEDLPSNLDPGCCARCALLASLRCCGWSPAVLLAVLLQLAPGHQPWRSSRLHCALAASVVPQSKSWTGIYFILLSFLRRQILVSFSKVALYYWVLFHSSLQLWAEFAADDHHYFFTVFVIALVPILLVFMLFVKSLFFQRRQTKLLYSLTSSMTSSVLLTTTTSFKSHVPVAFHRILVSGSFSFRDNSTGWTGSL